VRTLEQYLDLPYHVSLVRGETDNGGARWAASVEELPACTATGATPEEAVKRLRKAMSRWIADALSDERAIPEPRQSRTPSGRLLVRMPRTLHGELARAAEQEGVSLNQFITGALATSIGWRNEENGEGARASLSQSRPGLLTTALVANFVILAVAGAIAIAALVTAWRVADDDGDSGRSTPTLTQNRTGAGSG
jgi:antitoxin HicB